MRRYPFSPAVLDALPEEIAELFRGLEDTLLEEICSRLKIADQLNEVTVQDIRALRAHGISLDDIEKAIRETADVTEEKLDSLLDDVVKRNKAYYGELATLTDITMPDDVVSAADIQAIYAQTKNEFKNLTQSMGFVIRRGDKPVKVLEPAKAYQWALDQAEVQVMSGAISYNQAISGAVKQLADSGLKRIYYENDGKGHFEQLDVCARRAVMTGVNQLCQQYAIQAMERLGINTVEVTAHLGARNVPGPNGWEAHSEWQGKVFEWKEKRDSSIKSKYPDFEESTGYGTVTGLGGANCRHKIYPFIDGVMERTYTDDTLENMKPENRPKITFEGREYDEYQATQKQREIERAIRKYKGEQMAFKAAGLNDKESAARSKVRMLNKKYKEFSEAARLPLQTERTRVLYGD